MLTRWLTFTAFLAASASPQREASGQDTLTVVPTGRVKGHPEAALTLKCGDGKNAGVVQYWHTPFGDLQSPGFHSDLDPVFMQHDGSLVIPNSSIHHSGLYYCLLRDTQGTTLWPYQLLVDHNTQKNREGITSQQPSNSHMSRSRRSVGSDEERQGGVSESHFAGAVAASVLLTFVVGFSAGALSRRHVLRCLGAVTTRLRPQRTQRGQNDTLDHGSEVTVTTLPPMYTNQAFEMEQVCDNDSVNCGVMETTISSTASTPPAKPKRSFRSKQHEEQEPTAYLEGCDSKRQEDKRTEEEGEEAGRSLEENQMCDGETEEDEEKELSGVFLLGGSQTDTDEEECREDRDEDGKESTEEKKEWRQEKEVEQKGRSVEDQEERRGSQEEEGQREEQQREDMETTGEDGGESDMSDQSSTKTADNETVRKNQEDTVNSDITGGEASSQPVSRNRVIRLYQYDEDGQRFCHLPDPAPDEPGPAPRLKQRSLSLTRLNAIMAAATAGPLDRRDTGTEERQEREHFHMEI